MNSALKPIIPSEMKPALDPVLVTDSTGLARVEGFLNRTEVYGFDIETTMTQTYFNRRVRTLQFGDRYEQYIIDLLSFARTEDNLRQWQGNEGRNVAGGLREVLEVVRPHLESHERTKVGHNLQFEYEMMLWNLGILSTGFFDTLLAEKVIHAGLVNFNIKDFWALNDLTGRYCGLDMSKEHQTSFDLSTPLSEGQILYGALDVRLPMAIRQVQLSLLRKTVSRGPLRLSSTPSLRLGISA